MWVREMGEIIKARVRQIKRERGKDGRSNSERKRERQEEIEM